MERIPNETPPVERKEPMKESTKTILMAIAVIIVAVWIGSILQDADAGRIAVGVLCLICMVWGFAIASRGRETGTDGHGRKEYDEPSDNYRW